jgi:hypothetical protein
LLVQLRELEWTGDKRDHCSGQCARGAKTAKRVETRITVGSICQRQRALASHALDSVVGSVLCALVDAERDGADHGHANDWRYYATPERTKSLRSVGVLYCRREGGVIALHPRFGEIQRERSERAKNAGAGCRDLGAVFLEEGLGLLVHGEEKDAVAIRRLPVVGLVGHGEIAGLTGRVKASYGVP